MKALDKSHILAKLIAAKRDRLQKAKMRVPEAVVRQMAKTTPPAPSLRSALESVQRVRVIAEIKKASPSKGVLSPQLDVESLAAQYKANGAAAISVVTEEDHFQGDLSWVRLSGRAASLPVLRKDFVFDPYQIYETRSAQASAILLIAAMLKPDELKDLHAEARQSALDVVVEVHDEIELGEALEAGAQIVGVNNRDLKSFRVDIETSVRLANLIPQDRLFVVESGIQARQDIDRLLEVGADAFLIGEHLITSTDPGAALRALL